MNRSADHPIEAVVIGGSAGGLTALQTILGALPATFPVPILVVVHIARGPGSLAELLQPDSRLAIFDAEDKAAVEPGSVHIAVPDYHMLVGSDLRLSLCVDAKVCNTRPSIDVLFESAARVWKDRLIGVVLTGANQDGSEGLRRIRAGGGTGIVQDPKDAEVARMPETALSVAGADYVLPIEEIPGLLMRLVSAE